MNNTSEFGADDAEISTISSKLFKKVYGLDQDNSQSPKKQSSDQWHSDIAFEPVPADYTSLRLTQLPRNGGGMALFYETQSRSENRH